MREYARQLGLRRLDHPGAVPHGPAVEPLARARDARLRPRRSQADRQPSRTRPSSEARAPAASSRSSRAASGRRSPARSRTRTASSRRPAGRTRSPPRACSRSATAACRHGKRLVDSRSIQVRVSPARAFRPIRTDRRRDGLVLRRLALAAARLRSTCSWAASACAAAGATRRRRRRARHSTSGASRRTSRDRLLRLARRDEASRAGLAPVRGRRRRRRQHDPPDGDLPPDRPARHGLLVRPLPRPLVDLQGHADQDRRRCAGA